MKLFDKKVIFGFFDHKNISFLVQLTQGKRKALQLPQKRILRFLLHCLVKAQVLIFLISDLLQFYRVILSIPLQNKLKWQTPPPIIMGNFAICKMFETYKCHGIHPQHEWCFSWWQFLSFSWGQKGRRVSTQLLLTQHFIMDSITLLDSRVRFTEEPGDRGMPRIIWRTSKSSLCMTHERHHKRRLVPQILGGSREYNLLHWENYRTSCFSWSGDDID